MKIGVIKDFSKLPEDTTNVVLNHKLLLEKSKDIDFNKFEKYFITIYN